jgi:hypothetical protein
VVEDGSPIYAQFRPVAQIYTEIKISPSGSAKQRSTMNHLLGSAPPQAAGLSS